MADTSLASFSIEITDIESRGSNPTLTTSSGEQAQFYDGDVVRGFVVVDISSIYYLKYLGIDLVGSSSVNVQRIDSTVSAPKSFKNKEVFLRKSQALAGTPFTASPTPARASQASPAVTSSGRIVQLNKGRHILPFELSLETGCTPGSVSWQNHSLPSQASHNVSANLSYKLKVFCIPVDSSKANKVATRSINVGGFEHSRESLKSMLSKGSGKTKMGSLTYPLMDGQLTYAATLDSRAYHLGETALLTLVIDNKLPHPVNSISVRFNNFITLLGPQSKKSNGAGTATNSNGSSSSLKIPIPTNNHSSEESFTETEALTLTTERYTVKPNENLKKIISIVIPQGAFSTTQYTRSVNQMTFLDVSISIQSHTPSVSEKSFQVPIYVLNALPPRDSLLTHSSSSLSLSQTITVPPVIVGSLESTNSPTPASMSSSAILTLGNDSVENVNAINTSTGIAVSAGNGNSSTSSPASSLRDFNSLTPIQDAPGIVIWTNDDEVKQCTVCKHDFTLLRRRHHCRSCGRVMCGKCGKEATVEQLFGARPQRMCTLCLTELQSLYGIKGAGGATPTLSLSASNDIDESTHTISSYNSEDGAASPRNFRTSLQLLAAGSGSNGSLTNLLNSSNGAGLSNSGAIPNGNNAGSGKGIVSSSSSNNLPEPDVTD